MWHVLQPFDREEPQSNFPVCVFKATHSPLTHRGLDGCAAKPSVSKLCALYRGSEKSGSEVAGIFCPFAGFGSTAPRLNPLVQQCMEGYPDRLRYVYSHKYVSESKSLTNQIITFPPRMRASSALVSSVSTVIEVVSHSPLKGILRRDHIGRPH